MTLLAKPAPAIQRLNLDDVQSLFGPGQIRVWLDWDLLRAAGAEVTTEIVDVDNDPRLSTPWYVDPTLGREVPFDHDRRPPLRHQQVADHLRHLDAGRTARIADIAATCTPGAETWTLPCYAAGDALLVLDGNHRLAASAAHGIGAMLLAVVIHGPLDPAVLPDLAFFHDDEA